MPKKNGGLTTRENRLISDYALAKGLRPGLADVPNRMAYFAGKDGKQIKIPFSNIAVELKTMKERNKQS